MANKLNAHYDHKYLFIYLVSWLILGFANFFFPFFSYKIESKPATNQLNQTQRPNKTQKFYLFKNANEYTPPPTLRYPDNECWQALSCWLEKQATSDQSFVRKQWFCLIFYFYQFSCFVCLMLFAYCLWKFLNVFPERVVFFPR